MKLFTPAFFTAFACIVPCAALGDARYDEAARIMRETRAAWGAPGISVAIVENGRITWTGSDGLADVENRVAATPVTVWRIASVAKPISATAVMQLVEAGRIKLDEPIWTYIPWYPPKAEHVITVRHLLTNTSGIRHYKYEEGEKESTELFSSVEAGSHVHGVDREPLQFAPGTQYLYSSYAYLLLAGIVEQASGLTFEGYLRDRIFQPAGMDTAQLDRHREIIRQRASFYRKGEGGRGLFNAPYVDVSYKWSAGGILATVTDIARFAIALDDGKLLSEASRKESTTPYTLTSGASTDYGFGWHVSQEGGRRWVYHSGGATGGAAWLLRVPDERFAVVFMCNLERPGDGRKLAMEIAKAVLGPPSAAK